MAQGTVVTFYSYKGGVGRSFALANVAAALAGWGYRVLCIDWDLEAPGLGMYFRRWLDPQRPGLLEFLEDVTAGRELDRTPAVTTVEMPGREDRLHLIASGRQDDAYEARIQDIDWAALYEHHQFGTILEDLRTRWTTGYDFVLIDSRTGVTDIGGICTAQLPDILVFMFTANHQSLEGAIRVVRRADEARNRLPYDRARLLALPIPSRFDADKEYKLGVEWQRIFVDSLGAFYENWAVRETTPTQLVERTTIPYFSFWSFGEGLPIFDEPTRAPSFISYHIETLAALVGHRLTKSDLLIESRDSYVDSAAREGLRGGLFQYDLFISYSGSDPQASETAERLARLLRGMGVRVFLATRAIRKAETWSDELELALSRSKHMLMLIGRGIGRLQELELNRFMRQTIDEGSERTVIPVLLGGASPESLPTLLRRSQYLVMQDDPAVEEDAMREIAAKIADAAREGT
jgi:MinD-like ATPase involved in chromosome partitioning or flagellar assembly